MCLTAAQILQTAAQTPNISFFLKVPNDDKYMQGSGPKKYLQHI